MLSSSPAKAAEKEHKDIREDNFSLFGVNWVERTMGYIDVEN